MKQFLRYQISGSVFLGWCVIFYVSAQPGLFINELAKLAKGDSSTLFGLVSALPIGVLIHQFSVIIKNCFLGQFWDVLSDKPGVFDISALGHSENNEKAKYILERISNLNSFYYVRFDNGFLAPFLALGFSTFVLDIYICNIYCACWVMIFICIFTIIYIPCITDELKTYQTQLKELASDSNKILKTSSKCNRPKCLK